MYEESVEVVKILKELLVRRETLNVGELLVASCASFCLSHACVLAFSTLMSTLKSAARSCLRCRKRLSLF